MARSISDQRKAVISVQLLVGGLVFAVWVAVGVFVMQEDLTDAILKVSPYFTAFALGVFSRYMPGIHGLARAVESWTAARRRV
jgi:hypothetical protein